MEPNGKGMNREKTLLVYPLLEVRAAIGTDHNLFVRFWLEHDLDPSLEIRMYFGDGVEGDDKLSVGPEESFWVQQVHELIEGLIDREFLSVECNDVREFILAIEIGDLLGWNGNDTLSEPDHKS
jgi:hypothetical protein